VNRLGMVLQLNDDQSSRTSGNTSASLDGIAKAPGRLLGSE
jgi:hypothetical protein